MNMSSLNRNIIESLSRELDDIDQINYEELSKEQVDDIKSKLSQLEDSLKKRIRDNKINDIINEI